MPSCSRRTGRPDGAVTLVFAGVDDHPGTLETLQRLGFARPSEAIAVVRGWLHGRYRALRSERARGLITGLVPRLLAIVRRHRRPRRHAAAAGRVPGPAAGRRPALRFV